MATASQPANQGRADSGRLARPRAARLQLPLGRHPRRHRPWPAREARRHPRGASCRRRPLRRAAAGDRRSRAPLRRRRRPRALVVRVRIALPRGTDREAVISELDARGIQSARYLPCIHLQSYMRERFGFREGMCPIAEDASARTLALPFHARLEEDDQTTSRASSRTRCGRSLVAAAPPRRRAAGQGEALLVWTLLALDLVAVLVVYSVLDPAELYNVSGDGLEAGASRALVQSNFPIALVALPIVLLALDVLPRRAWLVGAPRARAPRARPGDRRRRRSRRAPPPNALPALGVALALALTIAAARRAGAAPGRAPQRRSRTRHRRGRRVSRLPAVVHGGAGIPSPGRDLPDGRSVRGARKSRHRRRPPRPPPRFRGHAARPLGAPPLATAARRSPSPARICRAPVTHARVRRGQPDPGLLARAGREAWLDGMGHPIGAHAGAERDVGACPRRRRW